jgi:peptide/nickel transport system permease protein
LLLVIPMILVLLTLVFFMLRVAPGDPVTATLGDRLPQEAIDARRAQLGLDRPILVQFFEYLGQVATFNFGEAISDNQPILDVVRDNGGATLTLTLAAFLIALGIGIPLGRLAARKRDSVADTGIRIFGVISYAAPIFFVGLLMQMWVARPLGLPTSGIASPRVMFAVSAEPITHILLVDAILQGNWAATSDIAVHHILPALALGLSISGVFIRMVRVNLLQTMQADYVEAARARGIAEKQVVRKHAFRNALVPVVTVIGLYAALLLGGAVLTETTFNWPGLGHKLLEYIEVRDYIAVQGIITFFALIVVVMSLVVDIVNALIDPRVRY